MFTPPTTNYEAKSPGKKALTCAEREERFNATRERMVQLLRAGQVDTAAELLKSLTMQVLAGQRAGCDWAKKYGGKQPKVLGEGAWDADDGSITKRDDPTW